MMQVYICGNGNICFADFLRYYQQSLLELPADRFLVCDFRGTDALAMEVLKCHSSKVSIFHIGDRPRYMPDSFHTKVSQWTLVGGFTNDRERDYAAIDQCSHFLAFDFNSNPRRKSGTQRNIERCLRLQKIRIAPPC